MPLHELNRRDFIKYLASGLSVGVLDWNSFPVGSQNAKKENQYDAIIIGAGLGGLSCGAAFARQGFKPLILEQHTKPGGYATTFTRDDFTFDVSLHSTTVGERNGLHNLIPGFPEIADVEFVPHPNLYRTIFPDYDIRVPQKNLRQYIDTLIGYFPDEKVGIEGIFEDMKGLADDVGKISSARGQINMQQFPVDYPYLFKTAGKTWGDLVNARIKNNKLAAIISSQWGYYGLPPSKLSPFYYAIPTMGYLVNGGYYPIGRSQTISDALSKFVQGHGGMVKLGARVKEILVKDHSAYGVKTDSGEEFTARVVVSNANAHDTLTKMIHEEEFLRDYLQKMNAFSVSLSCFQIFLGLKADLVKNVGIKDTEIFYNTGYDLEGDYQRSVTADVENGGYAISLYDNLYKEYSPKGKNTVNILVLQGFDHWKQFETDYFKDNKDAYRAEKKRMADVLIEKVEKTLLPGLRDAIEVMEIGTPLTNVRYTGNYRGAIYGWDQTVDNSGQRRLPHKTPVKNLYLAGAWTRPGHGYGAVIPSGLECFGEIMKEW
ncbi:MAG: NAD(P)/FAD-dependent oxidoreductase [Bacteroidota bacterium]|jgi:phytoene dehydrogenase-like protein